MKKTTKVWQTRYHDIDIVVENGWNLGQTEEKIQINGKTVYQYHGAINALGRYLEFREGDTKITVKLGSAWHCCGIACQILINDVYFYGNKIVLFSRSSASKLPEYDE